MATVTLENVKKIYPGNVTAVHDFNLKINDGEFIALVGPSGCGKSTTLRMIAGLEEISCGEVKIGDRVVNNVAPKDRDIAMVFQNYALYPHMSVYDNVAFGLKLRNFSKEDIKERVNNAAELLGIKELLHRETSALSGGQRQRVALGRTIVRQPKVFLLDEPLSNLDAKMRVQMRVEISALHKRLDSTMIYVTHDQVEAMTLGDRIVVMNDGYIQQVADPVTLYDFPENKFVAGFIGTPPMNFLDGTIVKKDGKLVFQEGSFDIPVPENMQKTMAKYENKEICFGARPEDIGSPTAEAIEGAPKMNGKVQLLEPLGAENYIYVKTEKNKYIARIDPHTMLKLDEDVNFSVNLAKIKFFDKDTDLVVKIEA